MQAIGVAERFGGFARGSGLLNSSGCHRMASRNVDGDLIRGSEAALRGINADADTAAGLKVRALLRGSALQDWMLARAEATAWEEAAIMAAARAALIARKWWGLPR